MKAFFKSIIIPFIIGILFYTFMLLGRNAELIAEDTLMTWFGIISGIIIIYLFIYSAIQNKTLINKGIAGFYFSHLVFSIAMPIWLLSHELNAQNNRKKGTVPNTITEKYGIPFNMDPENCVTVKYGTFVDGADTLIRYSENNKDYELFKRFGNKAQRTRINWVDACSYVRLKGNGMASHYIRIGNITEDTHQLLEKPALSNDLSAQSLKTFRLSSTQKNKHDWIFKRR